jgi:hypothetical protein
MAEKAYDKDKVNTEQTIPPEYQQHEKSFQNKKQCTSHHLDLGTTESN